MGGGHTVDASGGGDSRAWGKGGGCIVDVGGRCHEVVVVVDTSDGGQHWWVDHGVVVVVRIVNAGHGG